MRILIAPFITMLPTLGAYKRCMSIAESAIVAGHQVYFCIGEKEYNETILNKCTVIRSKEPAPMGLPNFIGKIIAKLVSKFNPPLEKSGSFTSFDSILYLTGGTRYDYLKKDVEYISNLLTEYSIDMIYSEYRLSANIAGQIKKVPVFTTYSKIGSSEWGYDEKSAVDVNKILLENKLPLVNGALDLLNWASYKIVPSHPVLEEVDNKENVLYSGSLTNLQTLTSEIQKQYILVYFGTGTFTPKKVKDVCIDTFHDSKYEVIVSSESIKECSIGNITFKRYANFEELLPKTAVFINHGGQNSTLSGLLYEVPQLIYPSQYFERQFNAENIAKNKCGKVLNDKDFNRRKILEAIDGLLDHKEVQKGITNTKKRVLSLGGSKEVIKRMEEFKK